VPEILECMHDYENGRFIYEGFNRDAFSKIHCGMSAGNSADSVQDSVVQTPNILSHEREKSDENCTKVLICHDAAARLLCLVPLSPRKHGSRATLQPNTETTVKGTVEKVTEYRPGKLERYPSELTG